MFDILSSLKKRTLPGEGKSLLVHLERHRIWKPQLTGQWGEAHLLYVQPRAKPVLYLYSNSCSATSTPQVQHSGAIDILSVC